MFAPSHRRAAGGLAAGRATPTPNRPVEDVHAGEPDRMTDAQADRVYALDADFAAAAMFS